MRTIPLAASLIFAAAACSSPSGPASGPASAPPAPAPGGAAAKAPAKAVVVTGPGASYAEALAAREVVRYLYLVTGEAPPIAQDAGAGVAAIVVGTKDAPWVRSAAGAGLIGALNSLEDEAYLIRTVERAGTRTMIIAGGGPAGTLYGAYRLAERLGVRFALQGDIVPSARIPFEVPVIDDGGKPLFAVRGIQPFHDFPEGPDWWNLDDYEAVLSQLPKLGMNFFGLHTYPEAGPNAEPTVWIGPPGEIGEEGKVKASYPSSWQNTLRGNWGYAAKKTSDFSFGADRLFERDAFGADISKDRCPEPKTAEAQDALFEDAAAMLRGAFEHARRLGIRICVGTETPLTVPKAVAERLRKTGKDPKDPAVIEELYAGIFARIAKACPIDWYWLWTPEGWTWSGVKEEEVQRTVADIRAALAALEKAGKPFGLATCGWVLGPPSNRALFDEVLPKDVALSCINRQVGMDPVEPGFAKVKGRPAWAIPWMEDDPALTSPQLWAGRMRQDAADALAYGCNGLLGIHWRTRILSPTVQALAKAAWDQSWKRDGAPRPERPPEGPEGGQFAFFPDHGIDGTDDDALYRDVRWDVAAYRLDLPEGRYEVVLKFCEPHYGEAGKRVFDVKIEGQTEIEDLDIFAKAGKDRALDFTFPGVEVKDGRLDIEFVKGVEFPSIAAIAVRGRDAAGKEVDRRVNCGGPAVGDWAADWAPSKPATRGLPADDFYADWARAEFGRVAGARLAKVFARIDGKLPRPSDWVDGPGGIKPDGRKWEDVEKEYAFVDEIEAARPGVLGPAEAERFEWWLRTFRYMKAMARTNCIWAQVNGVMGEAKAEKDEAARKAIARNEVLPLRKALVASVAEVYDNLLATVSNPGELGTVANWDQHILPALLERPGEEIEKMLGEPLPAEAMPTKEYRGAPRIIVPTVKTSVRAGERLRVKVIVLAKDAPVEAEVVYGPLGAAAAAKVALRLVARGVHEAVIPAFDGKAPAFEYHVRARWADGKEVCFPATAPATGQTVVIVPERS